MYAGVGRPGCRIVGKNHPSVARQQSKKLGNQMTSAKASGWDSDSDVED